MKRFDNRSPWSWIPTVYIAEGLPYFAVNVLTVVMYTNMGVSIKDMALLTGWLYLPWVIKPFWSPFIDLFRTKRWWVLGMQLLIAISMACAGLLLPAPFFLKASLIAFWIMAFCSATHDIAADGYYMIALDTHQQAAFVGIRSTFYRIASVIGQGGLVILAGWLETSTGNIPLAWSIVFMGLSVFFLALWLWDFFAMPRCKDDGPLPGVTGRTILSDFCNTFVTFFRKPGILPALAFILLYRLPEAFCIKLVQPFMLAPTANGGLGLDTAQVGLINGTFGVIGLLAGGISGGLAIARGGLKKWLWPMAMALTLPCTVYCVLSFYQPQSVYLISALVTFEQFGYGFGFSAFMLYLIYFSQGPEKTSHYAFCTAFMALGMMLPGMIAGYVFEWLSGFNTIDEIAEDGYFNFFGWVMACSLITFLVCANVKISPTFGKKDKPRN